jgi:uncharacterized protein YukE
MGNGNPDLNVDPPALLKSSNAISVPQETIGDALSRFYTRIGGLPAEPWGTDEIGQKFFIQYTGQDDPQGGRSGGYKLVLEAFQDLYEGLGNLGDKTKEMATNFISTEEDNTV